MANWYEPTSEQRTGFTAWINEAERPKEIQALARRFPPWKLWRMELESGHFQRVYVTGYGEPGEQCCHGNAPGEHHRHKMEDFYLIVGVDARFNVLCSERNVRGISPEDLVECDLPGPTDPVGLFDAPPDNAVVGP